MTSRPNRPQALRQLTGGLLSPSNMPPNASAVSSGVGASPSGADRPQSPGSGSRPASPQLRWKNSTSSISKRGARFAYSIDDDEREVEADHQRKLRKASLGVTRSASEADPSTSEFQSGLRHVIQSEPDDQDNSSGYFGTHPDYYQAEESPQDDDHHHDHHSHDDPDDNDDLDSNASVETFTLRERQDAINSSHPFGIRIWKPALYKKSRSVQQIAEGDIHSTPGKEVTVPVWLGNMLWSLMFGVLLWALCTIAAGGLYLLVWSTSARSYASILRNLGQFLLFPFGRYVELAPDENYLLEDEGEGHTLEDYERWQAGDVEHGRLFFGPPARGHSNTALINSSEAMADASDPRLSPESEAAAAAEFSENDPLGSFPTSSSADYRRKRRLFGRGKWSLGRIVFFLWFYALIAPVMMLISLVCWLGVFSIPMAKLTSLLVNHLRRHPLALSFHPASAYNNKNYQNRSNSPSILLCTYRALGWNYYKYTIDGTNIFFINLMFPVLFAIFDHYVLLEIFQVKSGLTSSEFIFCISMVSVVPLAYFIGQAVASISAQSSMGMGATLNAFFSTIVEVFLYAVALSQGKGSLVEGSVVGSIFAGVLFLPGISMCAGAIKRKTQRYNPRSAGVSSTMLLFAVIGAFAPTIFYQIHGAYELLCTPCDAGSGIDLGMEPPATTCRQCRLFQVPLKNDALYRDVIQPFSIGCSILLFISYCVGLMFTLRTHAAMIWSTPTSAETQPTLPPPSQLQPQPTLQAFNEHPQDAALGVAANAGAGHVADEPAGHDAPNWGRSKSTVILLGASFLYAIIAEILVDHVDFVLDNFAISEKLLGITVFALVPNTTEFVNAISFAMNGNIALSMEIGSAYALQVCLLQVPVLVLYSIWAYPDILPEPIHNYMFTLIFPRWDLLMVIFCAFFFAYIYAEGKSNYFKGSVLLLAYLVIVLGFYFSELAPPLSEESLSSLATAGSAVARQTVFSF